MSIIGYENVKILDNGKVKFTSLHKSLSKKYPVIPEPHTYTIGENLYKKYPGMRKLIEEKQKPDFVRTLEKDKIDYTKIQEEAYVAKDEWKTVDLVQFTITLKEPTSDVDKVKQFIEGVIREKFPNIENHLVMLTFGFKERVDLNYRVPLQLVKSLDKFMNHIMATLNRWEYQQKGVKEQGSDKNYEIYHVNRITIKISLSKGGKFTNFYLKGVKNVDMEKYIYNPPFDYNCAIECFRYSDNEEIVKKQANKIFTNEFKSKVEDECFKKQQEIVYKKKVSDELGLFIHTQRANEKVDKVFGDNMKDIRRQHQDKLSDNEAYAMTVKSLIYPNKTDKEDISVEEIKLLCTYFEKNCKVWVPLGNKFDLLQFHDFNYKSTINIIYFNNHYIYVKNATLLQYQACPNCKNWYKDLKRHKCQKCPLCSKFYSEKHDKQSCEERQDYTDDTKLKYKKIHKDYEAHKRIIPSDFETFPDKNGKLQVYAVGYAIDKDEPTILYGEDALDKFINRLLMLKSKHTVIFHNGGRFDLYFIYERLLQRNIRINKYILADGQYKQLAFGNVKMFDLYMHLPDSLSKLCVDFGLSKEESKQKFDHHLIKSWQDVEIQKDNWKPYLEKDITSMRTIYLKYADWIWKNLTLNVNKFMTLSQMTDTAWRTTLKHEIKLLPYEIDRFVRKSIYGGRCYPQKQYFESEDKDDYLLDCDVVSLYPTAMRNFMYPVGNYKLQDKLSAGQKEIILKHLNTYGNLEQLKTKHFVIEVDAIPDDKLVSAVLARHTDQGTEWNLKPIVKGVYNSIDIQEAHNHKYKFTEVYQFIEWYEEYPIFEEYITKIFELKKAAEKETVQYTVSKLLMNGLYGKQIQAPIVEQEALISTMEEWHKIRMHNVVYDVKKIDDNKYVVYYEKIEKDQAVNHPSYLGSIILGYSRKIMNGFIDAINGYYDIECSFWRTDTDSLIVHRKQYEEFKRLGKIGTDLGMLDLDIKGNIYQFRELCPKVYICIYVAFKDGTTKKHVRAKGMSKDAKNLLEVEHFDYVMFGKPLSNNESIHVKDDFKNEIGKISFEDNTIKIKNDNVLKKYALNIPSTKQQKGVEISQIYAENLERTLGRTQWNKRVRIPGHKHLASYPIGYSQ